MLNSALIDFFRCPESFADFALTGSLSEDSGFFRFGQDVICYGKYASGILAQNPTGTLHDTLDDLTLDGAQICLPFDPADVIDSLRCERYFVGSRNGTESLILKHSLLWNAYYLIRPLLQLSARKHLQKIYLHGWEKISFPNWPVDFTVERIFEQLMILALQA